MTLIKSISGIRGTIGGEAGEGLSPVDIVKFTSGFAAWVERGGAQKKIVIGRDARISGEMVRDLICATLVGMGIDVIDLGLSTTPTVEMAVKGEQAGGGIIITASHNPAQWNALKLLNSQGEFVSAQDGEFILALSEGGKVKYADVNSLGKIVLNTSYLNKHIEQILALPLVDKDLVASAKFSIVLDAVNSTGGVYVPALLKALGIKDIHEIHCKPDGLFAHNPEPLAENLGDLSSEVLKRGADLGISVDPDVDRLVLMCEDGVMFGEEYTLVAVSDYVLSSTPGNTVSNLSSTRALDDVTQKYGGNYYAAAVGEVNVVAKMKEVHAVIGGEGNGGVIYPDLHYGRDALVGIALFLTHLAKTTKTMTQLKASYPLYFISKNKIDLPAHINVDELLGLFLDKHRGGKINTEDGIRIDTENKWVHLRKSNTEPIIRIYAEASTEKLAKELASSTIKELNELI